MNPFYNPPTGTPDYVSYTSYFNEDGTFRERDYYQEARDFLYETEDNPFKRQRALTLLRIQTAVPQNHADQFKRFRNQMKDRGYTDQDIKSYLDNIYANPEKYLGSDKLPSSAALRGSKRYKADSSSTDIFLSQALIYADEASRIYSQQQEERMGERREGIAQSKQQAFDANLADIRAEESGQSSFELSSKAKEKRESDEYIASKTSRQTSARNTAGSMYAPQIQPMQRPI